MPFPFYNTAAPTPSSKNTINSVAVTYGIRDYLLNSNLGQFYPQIPTNINGSPHVGEPVLDTSINGNTNVIPTGLPLQTWGLYRYNLAVLPNQFINNDTNAPELLSIDDIPTIQGVFGSVDFPQGSQYPTSPTSEISQYGLLGKTDYAQFRKTATLYNLYVDASQQYDVGDYISLQPNSINQQIQGYMDEYGGINLGQGQGLETANVIGSILNGQGIGLAKAGIIPNFDVRASLTGRILGGIGTLKDTRLGQIGGQQLAFALANNAAFNLEEDILGGLNLQDNILAMVRGNELPGFRPNYSITVPETGVGRAFDYAASILGFTLPKSNMTESASIFSSENTSGNIQRANAMLVTTGKGQIVSLGTQIVANLQGSGLYDNPTDTPFRTGYSPGYKNRDGQLIINPLLYAFYDDVTNGTIINFLKPTKSDPSGVIPEISFNRTEMIKEYGFISPEDVFIGPFGNSGYNNRKVSSVGFTWLSDNGEAINVDISRNNDDRQLPLTFNETSIPATFITSDGNEVSLKKTLLYKTQQLFNSKGMMNLVSVKGVIKSDGTINSSQIQTSNAKGISKGSAVISGSKYSEDGSFNGAGSEAGSTYCRSWTTIDRYDKVSKLIRNRGLDKTYPYRHQYENSVLDDNGFVKIAPYSDDNVEIKKYMFSIENLAWSDNVKDLIPCEQGSGDLLSGKKGRIMWFPPYNIQFNETSSVNWEKTDFVGRGESVYTYNNTERSGSLSFQIIIDHPSYMNAFRGSNGPEDNYIASYIAGCVEPNQYFVDRLTTKEIQSIVTQNVVQPKKYVAPVEVAPPTFSVYYPNDVPEINTEYENGDTTGIGIYQGQVTPPIINGTPSPSSPKQSYDDNTDFGLNAKPITLPNGNTYDSWVDDAFITDLAQYLTNTCPSCKMKIQSTASLQGYEPYNSELANLRSTNAKTYFESRLQGSISSDRIEIGENKIITSGTQCKEFGDRSVEACKKDRRTEISFYSDQTVAAEKYTEADQPEPLTTAPQPNLNTRITNRFYTECSFFDKMTQDDPFVFDSFRQKIKYFHPAFHSTTPEGFNSRLTFLQQCTRQGPTLESVDANNLAFGRAPVCILRIGDFYNTKIVIDNISIDYEPLVWDLNPEGVGVQPMIANVTMSFKFIGGSTLEGAINKLQNALSFNYYANTQVYDARADYISKDKPFKKVGRKTINDNGETVISDIKTLNIKDSASGYYINNLINDEYFGDANKFAYEGRASNNSDFITTESPNTQNQVLASDKSESGQQEITSTGPSEDIDRLMLMNVVFDELLQQINFTVSKRNPSVDNSPLSQDYELILTVQNSDFSDKNVYVSSQEPVLSAVNQSQNFSFDISTLTPTISDFTNKYNIMVVQFKGTQYRLKTNIAF